MEIKNYGLNLELEKLHQSESDWKFGSSSKPCAVPIPKTEIESYLPAGEIQRGVEDTSDCASRAPHNILETKLNYLLRNNLLGANAEWLIDNGFTNEEGGVEISDAFTAILSKTTRQGNSLIAPLKSLNENGFIPKSKLPLEPWMTWEDYHDPERITDEMIQIGLESKKRFPLNYEWVGEKDFGIVLETDEIITGGFAWPVPENGEYPQVDMPANHAFDIFKLPRFLVFDNYIDECDGDFVKKLAQDYSFIGFGYRLYIAVVNEVRQEAEITREVKGLWSMISNLLKNIWMRITRNI